MVNTSIKIRLMSIVLTFMTAITVMPFDSVFAVEVPKFLYNWKRISGLKRYEKNLKQNNGVLKLEPPPPSDDPNDRPTPLVNFKYPFLDTSRMIFTWTNPIGGMGRSMNELYAGTDYKPTDARLLVLKINPNARIVKISDDVNQSYNDSNNQRVFTPPPELDPAHVDIYVFEWWNTNQIKDKPLYTEYIINNTAVIEEYIYDIPRVKEIIKKELPKFSKDNPTFEESDIYGGRTNDLYYSRRGLDRIHKTLESIVGPTFLCRSLF